ncbi:MAG: hypothetical protein ACR2QA_10540 [Solirubrobacteraceae bacterium]
MPADAFTELVSPPAHGRVFTRVLVPGLADCAPSGRIRLDALARWLQDIAYADVDEGGLAPSAAWVVRRTRLCVLRFPASAKDSRCDVLQRATRSDARAPRRQSPVDRQP